ncbi:metallophosphoesterase [Halomonas nitroreducens]|uniref:Metallophosphoesterase n=1 Tax=Halomonas nitroreducens TaxID=447425 RepID=A0A3S0JAS3_9GAMM|nr:metallophosphoesterase [Halomonas nitroreducens]RTR04994.1 metallophosphoesterase [Halomonas nitroreducens]
MIRHATNHRGRDFFVGDLHGEYDLLMAQLSRVAFDQRVDRLFSVGDLIDRGPASLSCLRLSCQPWFHGVRGNHEMLAHDALFVDGAGMALWRINGGAWALDKSLDEVRRVLEAALQHLPYAREVRVGERRIGMVHAEPPADWSGIEECDRHALVWGRERIRRGDTTPVTGIDAVVVGHTIVEAPRVLGNVHYLDTGAFLTGRLTLVEARELLPG